MADLLSQIRDVDSPQSRLAQAVATGVFTTLVAPRKLSSRALITMHTLSGLAGAVGSAVVLGEKASPQVRAMTAVGVGAAVFGASALGTTADMKTEEWLLRRGVHRPRLWLGVIAAALTWMTSAPKGIDGPTSADATEETGETPSSKATGGAGEADTG